VDADNVPAARIVTLLGAVAALDDVRLVAVGHPEALAAVNWPAGAQLTAASGWQRADLLLAAAYRPDNAPLVLVSGDGDFGLLAARHPGPVLVVSEAPSGRLRAAATVIDPVHDGPGRLEQWLTAALAQP